MPATRSGPRSRVGPARADPARRETGSVTIQIVILMPLMFLALFAATQAALIYHGRTAAIASAQEGARAAAAQHATTSDGHAAAAAFLQDAGGQGVLNGVNITVTRTPQTATATVSGTTLSVIPGWSPRITQSATAPVERLTG